MGCQRLVTLFGVATADQALNRFLGPTLSHPSWARQTEIIRRLAGNCKGQNLRNSQRGHEFAINTGPASAFAAESGLTAALRSSS